MHCFGTRCLPVLLAITFVAPASAQELQPQCTSAQVEDAAFTVNAACGINLHGKIPSASPDALPLPAECSAECAVVVLPWQNSACFETANFNADVKQALLAFGATCAAHRDLDASGGTAQADGDGFRLCFPTQCAAPILLGRGQVVVEGCAAGGALGATCRIGCAQVHSPPRSPGGGLPSHYPYKHCALFMVLVFLWLR
jgi:hypothetical protein